MNKKSLMIGIAVAGALLVMLSAVALSSEWNEMNDNGPTEIPFTLDEDGALIEGSLNMALFEDHGYVLFILALLLFGAIIGGAYVAKEGDDDDSD